MIGKTFGLLTVVERSENSPSNKRRWVCRCSCGAEKVILDAKLKNGNTKSCGCYRKEVTKGRYTKHGKTRTPLYMVWMGMKRRCCDPKHKSYHTYGGIGITVCKEWSDYSKFEEWSMNNGYEKGLHIDRKNNNGNYTPNNCRFTTVKVNANNKRNNRHITINGITRTISQWSDVSGIEQKVIQARIKYGWSGEELISPKRT